MNEDKKVLLIEDDSVQARNLDRLIRQAFPGVSVNIIGTELEFRDKLPEIVPGSYRIALIDLMLRWTDPSPEMIAPPKEIYEQGFFLGGLRCRQALLEKKIRSVIFTVHDRETFPQLKADIDYVQKGPSFDPILNKLRGYLDKAG